jgi:hypothetical protein
LEIKLVDHHKDLLHMDDLPFGRDAHGCAEWYEGLTSKLPTKCSPPNP